MPDKYCRACPAMKKIFWRSHEEVNECMPPPFTRFHLVKVSETVLRGFQKKKKRVFEGKHNILRLCTSAFGFFFRNDQKNFD